MFVTTIGYVPTPELVSATVEVPAVPLTTATVSVPRNPLKL